MFYINCTQGGKRARKEEREGEGKRTGRPAAGHNAGAPRAHRKFTTNWIEPSKAGVWVFFCNKDERKIIVTQGKGLSPVKTSERAAATACMQGSHWCCCGSRCFALAVFLGSVVPNSSEVLCVLTAFISNLHFPPKRSFVWKRPCLWCWCRNVCMWCCHMFRSRTSGVKAPGFESQLPHVLSTLGQDTVSKTPFLPPLNGDRSGTHLTWELKHVRHCLVHNKHLMPFRYFTC